MRANQTKAELDRAHVHRAYVALVGLPSRAPIRAQRRQMRTTHMEKHGERSVQDSHCQHVSVSIPKPEARVQSIRRWEGHSKLSRPLAT